jgi:putative ABC transport system permease protein
MSRSDWSLAVRNLLRNRRRSMSTLVALAIGLCSIMLFSGFKANLGYTMLTAFVRAGGHLQVQHRDYLLYGSANPVAYSIADHARILEAIRNDATLGPMVDVATPVLRFGGLAGNFEAGASRTVIGTGYVPADLERVRQWNEYAVPLLRPPLPLLKAAADSALIGVGVARVLGLCEALKVPDCVSRPAETPAAEGAKAALPADIAALSRQEAGAAPRPAGARIELLSSGPRGAPNVAALEVVAVEDQGIKELDEISVIVPLAAAQRLVFGRGPQRATAVMVLLKHTADDAAAAERLREVLQALAPAQPLSVRDFADLNPYYVQSDQLFDTIFGFFSLLIGAIVLFTVGNTMNTAVIERTVEIGTLRAIGIRQSGVRRLFVIEGFILGCVGALAGVLLAVLLAALINASGLTWLPPASSDRLPLHLRIFAETATVTAVTIGLVVIATLSAWWPAGRAAHLNVVEALRHA